MINETEMSCIIENDIPQMVISNKQYDFELRVSWYRYYTNKTGLSYYIDIVDNIPKICCVHIPIDGIIDIALEFSTTTKIEKKQHIYTINCNKLDSFEHLLELFHTQQQLPISVQHYYNADRLIFVVHEKYIVDVTDKFMIFLMSIENLIKTIITSRI